MSGEAVPGRAAPSGPPPNDAYTVRRLAANTYDWLAPKLSSPERKALDRIMALMDEGMALRAAPSGEPSAEHEVERIAAELSAYSARAGRGRAS
jgi:hypothetical protein